MRVFHIAVVTATVFAAAGSVMVGCRAPAARKTTAGILARWEDQRRMDPDSLANLIEDGDAHVRLAALRTAGRIGRDGVLPQMLAALHDPSDAVAAEAALALGFLGDARAATALGSAVAQAHPRVRRAALFALARVKNDGAALWEPALHGQVADAVLAWNALRDRAVDLDSARLATTIRSGLVRRETEVLWRVLRCSERSGSRELIPVIAPLTRHGDAQVRIHACRALAKLAGGVTDHAVLASAMDATLGAYSELGRFNRRDGDRVRIAALRCIGALAGGLLTNPETDPMPMIEKLTEGARRPNPHVARTALEAMAAAVSDLPPAPYAAVRESLLPAWRIRLLQAARKGLAQEIIGNEVPDDAPEPSVRAAAVRAVCALRGPGLLRESVAAAPGWSVCIEDPAPQVHEEAWRAALASVLPLPLSFEWIESMDADHPQRLLLAAAPAFGRARARYIADAADPGYDASLQGPAIDVESFDDQLSHAYRGMLERGPFAVSAQCATLLGAYPSPEDLEALLDAWHRAAGWTAADVRLGVLDALEGYFVTRGNDRLPWTPDDSLRICTGRLLEDGFDAADVRLRLRAREIAVASGLLPTRRIPTEASLRATVPAVRRNPAQGPLALPFDAPEVVCRTARGSFTIQLDGRRAPNTCTAFLTLIRRGFYEGLLFHRVVPDFVIQGGCPDGTGWGGPGFNIRSEWSDVPFERGTVGVAHSGKDTGGSQFFVCLSPQPHLNGRYTVFGRVSDGMEVAERIQPDDAFRLEIIGE